jgi:hypothetical protein
MNKNREKKKIHTVRPSRLENPEELQLHLDHEKLLAIPVN